MARGIPKRNPSKPPAKQLAADTITAAPYASHSPCGRLAQKIARADNGKVIASASMPTTHLFMYARTGKRVVSSTGNYTTVHVAYAKP